MERKKDPLIKLVRGKIETFEVVDEERVRTDYLNEIRKFSFI